LKDIRNYGTEIAPGNLKIISRFVKFLHMVHMLRCSHTHCGHLMDVKPSPLSLEKETKRKEGILWLFVPRRKK
jgi:hypothetical protein